MIQKYLLGLLVKEIVGAVVRAVTDYFTRKRKVKENKIKIKEIHNETKGDIQERSRRLNSFLSD